ncbi:MAG: Cys-Gln thioester bond-forming surface protein [Oscillospiraceae bacterium]|nr:Cys-Gln thioester bond-forming surface protein [Oscillospiraceae bacterium]
MKKNIDSNINSIFRNRRRRKIISSLLFAVMMFNSVFLVFIATPHLAVTADTEILDSPGCGYDEHTHEPGCYGRVLSCDLDETEGHIHNEACIGLVPALTCELEESEGHEHGEECVGMIPRLVCESDDEEHEHDEDCWEYGEEYICELEESEGHIHNEECYTEQEGYICGLEESEGHIHTDDCWETDWDNLICDLHIHNSDCYAKKTTEPQGGGKEEDTSTTEETTPITTTEEITTTEATTEPKGFEGISPMGFGDEFDPPMLRGARGESDKFSVTINVTKIVEGEYDWTTHVREEFTFKATQVDETGETAIEGGAYGETGGCSAVENGTYNYPITIEDLEEGEYYFKIEEIMPDGWTSTTPPQVVKVIVGPDGATTTSSSVIEWENEIDYDNLEGYRVVSTLPGEVYETIGNGFVLDSDNSIVIGALYCADKVVSFYDESDNPYSPYVLYDGDKYFARDTYPSEGITDKDVRKEISWVLSNGFWSNGVLKGESYDYTMGSNYKWLLQKYGFDVPEAGDPTVLAQWECFAATQLAIWYFANGMNLMSYSPADLLEVAKGEIYYSVSNENIIYAIYHGLVEEAENEITIPSIEITFDTSKAAYTGMDTYGPIKVNVEVEPLHISSMLSKIMLTGMNGYKISDTYWGSGTPTLELDNEDEFYVYVGSEMPAAGVGVEVVTAVASVSELAIGGSRDSAGIFYYIETDEEFRTPGQALCGIGNTGTATVTGTAELNLYGVSFTNTYEEPGPETRSLTLTKTVVNPTGNNPNKEFTFNIWFDGVETGIIRSTSEKFVEKAVGSGSGSGVKWTGVLKNGETVTFTNIPLGTKYQIIENDYSSNDYSTAYKINTGDPISERDTRLRTISPSENVEFTNTYNEPVPKFANFIINGKKIVTGTDAPNATFTFMLKQVNESGALITPPTVQQLIDATDNILKTTVTLINGVLSPAKGEFNFAINDLPEGEYYFKVSEQDDGGANWTYDTIEYIVRVEVTNGHAIVYYPDGTIAIDDKVMTTSDPQTIDIDPPEVTDDPDLKHGGDINSLNYFNGSESGTYRYKTLTQRGLPAAVDPPMAFRYIYTGTSGNPNIIIGAAYCIDMHNDNVVEPIYKPYNSFEEFCEVYPNYEEILWLTRNGFMSKGGRTEYGNWDYKGDSHNLEDIKTLTDIDTLTEDEAYCATQFAIWHFSDGIDWQLNDGDYQILNQNIYKAYFALIEAAKDATNKGIAEVTLGVHFDIDDAKIEDGWYGPVKIKVDLLPLEFIDKSTVPVYLTPAAGMTISQTAGGPVYNGPYYDDGTNDTFYVNIGSSSTEAILELVTATATINEEILVNDVFILNNQDTSGNPNWEAAQAVTGIGAIKREVSLEATATLYYGASDYMLTFKNKYTPTEIIIKGKKVVEGTAPGETFIFTLTEWSSGDLITGEAIVDGITDSVEVETNGEGEYTFEFKPIRGLTNDTTYYFKISEVKGSKLGWDYDENSYIVVVVVDKDGKFEIYYPQSGDPLPTGIINPSDKPFAGQITYQLTEPEEKPTYYDFKDTKGEKFLLFCADKFVGPPTSPDDLYYDFFHIEDNTSSALVYALYNQLTTNSSSDDFLNLFGFKSETDGEYKTPFDTENKVTQRERCKQLAALLIWYYEFKTLWPEYEWDPSNALSWPETLPAKDYPLEAGKKLPQRTEVASRFYNQELLHAGLDYTEVFAIAVGIIDKMMDAYSTVTDSKCITSINMIYEPDSDNSGWLSFSYDGFIPPEHELKLSWVINGAMDVSMDENELTSGEYIKINITDKFYIEHSGTGSVEFALEDNLYYLMNGSIEGEYYISHEYNRGEILWRQRMIIGFAQFAKMNCVLEIGKGDNVTFKNKYVTTDMTITKFVDGNPWEDGETFEFTVEFSNNEGIICSDATLEGGKWKITLTYSKRSVTFKNIPLGTTYTITEVDADDEYHLVGIKVDGNDAGDVATGIVSGIAESPLKIHVKYTNRKYGPKLPETGGIGVFPFMAIGGLLMMAVTAGALLYYKKLQVKRPRKIKKSS